MASSTPLKLPSRFLFITSIGNPTPYERTRHSAGHYLLKAIKPQLPVRFPFIMDDSHEQAFWKTWRSTSYMNDSGKKLRLHTRAFLLQKYRIWERKLRYVVLPPREEKADAKLPPIATKEPREWELRGVEPASLKQFCPTLVILHDELEAPLGKVVVRRGGAREASLRGHRGLISIMKRLERNGLYPGPNKYGFQLSILRIGVGIGRPESRDPQSVADYVLARMTEKEEDAVINAGGHVLDLLADEFYRPID